MPLHMRYDMVYSAHHVFYIFLLLCRSKANKGAFQESFALLSTLRSFCKVEETFPFKLSSDVWCLAVYTPKSF